jgi:hypothetical protein
VPIAISRKDGRRSAIRQMQITATLSQQLCRTAVNCKSPRHLGLLEPIRGGNENQGGF